MQREKNGGKFKLKNLKNRAELTSTVGQFYKIQHTHPSWKKKRERMRQKKYLK